MAETSPPPSGLWAARPYLPPAGKRTHNGSVERLAGVVSLPSQRLSSVLLPPRGTECLAKPVWPPYRLRGRTSQPRRVAQGAPTVTPLGTGARGSRGLSLLV
jgi:hypothetical protein